MTGRISAIVLALGATVLSGAALAQDVSSAISVTPTLQRSDVAGNRFEPEFDPQPINAGPFVLEPSITMVAGFDANVFNRDNAQSDAVAVITPRLIARANTPLHLLQFAATGQIRRFASFETENSEEYTLRTTGRYDLSERNNVFASASYASQIEPRSSVASIANAAEPVNYKRLNGGLGADLEFGDLSLRPSVSFAQVDYSAVDLIGGGSADQSFRDIRSYGGDLSVGYRISGPVFAFTSLNYGESSSQNADPAVIRGSQNYSVVAGLRGELSPVVSAEFAAGYRERDYKLPRFLDYSGLTYRADVQWFATPLVTLRLRADQDFLNSGNAQVAGILSNSITASAYYDPLRNLRIGADLSYQHNDYRETDTRAERPSVRVQAQYRLNRNISVGTYARLLHQDVSGTPIVQSFTSFQTGIGVTLTP